MDSQGLKDALFGLNKAFFKKIPSMRPHLLSSIGLSMMRPRMPIEASEAPHQESSPLLLKMAPERAILPHWRMVRCLTTGAGILARVSPMRVPRLSDMLNNTPVRVNGLEPSTSCSPSKRSTKLSYTLIVTKTRIRKRNVRRLDR